MRSKHLNFMDFSRKAAIASVAGAVMLSTAFALAYTLTAKKQPSREESVRLAEHILNNFDIPFGWIRDNKEAAQTPLEFTQWSSIADLKTKHYYVKTYVDQVLRGADLMSFDLDAKTVRSAALKPNMTPPALDFAKP